VRRFSAGDLVYISKNLNPEEYTDNSMGFENTPGWDESMRYTQGKVGKVMSGNLEWGGIRVEFVPNYGVTLHDDHYIFLLKDLTPYNPVSKWRRRGTT